MLRRIRKHNCKHIRLVLTQLDIAQAPGKWKQASLRHCNTFSCALSGIYKGEYQRCKFCFSLCKQA